MNLPVRQWWRKKSHEEKLNTINKFSTMYERKKNKHAHTKHKTNSHIKLINHLPRAQLYFVYCMYECDFINFDLIVFLCPSFSSFFPLILYAIFSRQKTIICPSCAPQSSNRTLHTSIVVVIRARTHAYIYIHINTRTHFLWHAENKTTTTPTTIRVNLAYRVFCSTHTLWSKII